MASGPAQLQRDALGLGDVIFQGITHIAPATSVVFALPEIADQAGATMPLSMLLAVIVSLFVANTVAQFARYVPSSGGYYTFVSRGLGPRFGFLTTWSYLIYDIIGPAAALGALGFTVADFLRNGTGIDLAWWTISVAATVIVWVLTYRGIRFSTRATTLLGIIEILIMLVLGVSFLVHPGPGSSALAPVNPTTTETGWSGVLGGMVFSILALTGFEAPAPLAQETKRPARFIYQAIFSSLIIVGLFFVFMAYASAIGWGTGRMAAFAREAEGAAQSPYFTLAHKLWGAGWWLVLFAIVNGTLAVAISGTNAASRVMYTMAQAGTLPSGLRAIHPIHKTPTMAIHVQQIVQIASFLICGLCIGPDLIFNFLGTITTLAVIVLYVLANFALTAFMTREHRQEFRLGLHGIVPALGTLLLIPVLYVTLRPLQEYPQSLTPYFFIAFMIAGFVLLKVIERRRPEALSSSFRISTVEEPATSK
jgi:amino acid transporter